MSGTSRVRRSEYEATAKNKKVTAPITTENNIDFPHHKEFINLTIQREGVDKLVKRIADLKQKMEQALPLLSKEIDTIISDHEQSTQRIEAILDNLLDFGQLGVGRTEFERLNQYYSTVNPTYARDYTRLYQENNTPE